MPVFISHSHQDKDFVDRLAMQLVYHRVRVWVDRWELNVGDSLTTRIEREISGASALLLVLSRASVASDWVRRELNAGLVRELEEKRVVVMPVLKEECDVPLFLRDKLYADFRTDFDSGLSRLLDSLAPIANFATARVDSPEWLTDWAIDWGDVGPGSWTRLTLMEHSKALPISCLSTITIVGDEPASQRFKSLLAAGEDDAATGEMIEAIADSVRAGRRIQVLLTDTFPKELHFAVSGAHGSYGVDISARRLGDDTGRDTVLHVDDQVLQAHARMQDVTRRP